MSVVGACDDPMPLLEVGADVRGRCLRRPDAAAGGGR
jgi:hypothetical protein